MEAVGHHAEVGAGFCALRLAQRLLDPVPAGNCKLQTVRQYYRLAERGAHTSRGDAETVADLLTNVLRPITEQRGLDSWTEICAYTKAEWFPSRIAFGKFKGRQIQDAFTDIALLGWRQWLVNSVNTPSAFRAPLVSTAVRAWRCAKRNETKRLSRPRKQRTVTFRRPPGQFLCRRTLSCLSIQKSGLCVN